VSHGSTRFSGEAAFQRLEGAVFMTIGETVAIKDTLLRHSGDGARLRKMLMWQLASGGYRECPLG
jgi:hypothetical protein